MLAISSIHTCSINTPGICSKYTNPGCYAASTHVSHGDMTNTPPTKMPLIVIGCRTMKEARDVLFFRYLRALCFCGCVRLFFVLILVSVLDRGGGEK